MVELGGGSALARDASSLRLKRGGFLRGTDAPTPTLSVSEVMELEKDGDPFPRLWV